MSYLVAADEYLAKVNLNIYDSPICTGLATQAAASRHLRVLSPNPVSDKPLPQPLSLSRRTKPIPLSPPFLRGVRGGSKLSLFDALEVCLCEDEYSGWLPVSESAGLEPATTKYQARALSPAEIKHRLPAVIAFTQNAMKQPNYYLWGGTVGPNYDCSGLMQAAFASEGIWLPRDSYQQEAFTRRIAQAELLPGDLVFFGTTEKINHVALYLGDGYYIHSSGKETGNNGIGIDLLSERGNDISRHYYQKLRSCGRVESSFKPSST